MGRGRTTAAATCSRRRGCATTCSRTRASSGLDRRGGRRTGGTALERLLLHRLEHALQPHAARCLQEDPPARLGLRERALRRVARIFRALAADPGRELAEPAHHDAERCLLLYPPARLGLRLRALRRGAVIFRLLAA